METCLRLYALIYLSIYLMYTHKESLETRVGTCILIEKENENKMKNNIKVIGFVEKNYYNNT